MYISTALLKAAAGFLATMASNQDASSYYYSVSTINVKPENQAKVWAR